MADCKEEQAQKREQLALELEELQKGSEVKVCATESLNIVVYKLYFVCT